MSSLLEFNRLASYSANEVTTLVNYCRGFVLKDEDEANYFETSDSIANAIKCQQVFDGTDSYPVHDAIIFSFDLCMETAYGYLVTEVKDSIASKYQNNTTMRADVAALLRLIVGTSMYVTKLQILNAISTIRSGFLNSFVDTNIYYANLKTKYNINPLVARRAKNFDILYIKNPIQSHLINNFNTIYKENQKYFMKVLYTKAFSKDMIVSTPQTYNNYFNKYCGFMICVMTIVKLINFKIQDNLDVMHLDEYLLDEFLYSFGFTEFKSFPLQYKKQILLSLNDLIQNKGTDKVLSDILKLFELDNICIHKYYLVKTASSNSNKTLNRITTNLRFISHDIKYPSINNAIRHSDYKSYTYEAITASDDKWQIANKDEIALHDFNYVQTKHISIFSNLDMMKESIPLSFIHNTINNIGSGTQVIPNTSPPVTVSLSDRNLIEIHIDRISKNSIKMDELLFAVQGMIGNYFGVSENIVANDTAKILQFTNIDNSILNNTILGASSDNPNHSVNKALVLNDILNTSVFDQQSFSKYFSECYQKYINFKNYIKKRQSQNVSPSEFSSLKELFNSKFTTNYSIAKYNGKPTISSYLSSENTDLSDYFTKFKTYTASAKYDDILSILNTITVYIRGINPNVNLANRFNMTLIDYVKQMVDIFKAYTVMVKDVTLLYTYNEDIFFKLLDELAFTGIGFTSNDSLQTKLFERYVMMPTLFTHIDRYGFELSDKRKILVTGLMSEDRIGKLLSDKHSSHAYIALGSIGDATVDFNKVLNALQDFTHAVQIASFYEYSNNILFGNIADFNVNYNTTNVVQMDGNISFADITFRDFSVMSPTLGLNDRTSLRKFSDEISTVGYLPKISEDRIGELLSDKHSSHAYIALGSNGEATVAVDFNKVLNALQDFTHAVQIASFYEYSNNILFGNIADFNVNYNTTNVVQMDGNISFADITFRDFSVTMPTLNLNDQSGLRKFSDEIDISTVGYLPKMTDIRKFTDQQTITYSP